LQQRILQIRAHSIGYFELYMKGQNTMRWACLLAILLTAYGLGCKADKAADEAAAGGAASFDWKAATDAWEEFDPIPNYRLVDQDGKSFSMDRFSDSYVLVGFVFSRCPMPKACPLTMKRMQEIQTKWKERVAKRQTGGKKIRLLAVTIDPDFDTPDILTHYGKAYEADPHYWTLATGPKGLVQTAFPSLFNVFALPRGDGVISHNVNTGLLAPNRMSIKEWTNNEFTPDEVIDLVLKHGTAAGS